MREYTGLEIAVIGMSGRFPGAEDLNEFWENLKNGVESIRSLSDEDLINEGEVKSILDNPLYVKASSYLDNKEYFDSAFFGYRPDEAKLMDPQTRIFHECVWKALEDAGCNFFDYKGKIGLFAGASSNLNWEIYSSLINKDGLVDDFSAMLLRNVEFINTRISYLFNLRGPSIFLTTACSTSLVSIQQACKSLLTAECNIAIAGGVTIKNHSKKGYLFKDGGINSQDGHCRAFDELSNGTVIGEGVGVVVLKTLKNAIKDRDNILAVIIGSGVNNDGNNRVGYTAPGIDGQTDAIMMAHKWAKIEPESISYVETHGTGTVLGDPIEVEALSRAFGGSNQKYCAIGSVKTNIGHADSAAGVAGLIKTVLALKHKQIPASLNYTTPNPKISFSGTPFYVNTELREWKSDKYPLRAGVSSFGIGGTNAHVVLEEAPKQPASSGGREHQLLILSAKTPAALDRNTENLIAYLRGGGEDGFADIAYTLQVGRVPFSYRRMVVCKDKEEAIAALSSRNLALEGALSSDKGAKAVVFMFSGQGSQYLGMCQGLYEQEESFRIDTDRCFEMVKQRSGKDLKTVVFGGSDSSSINSTEFTQPALFVIEYALARLLMRWGISPGLMIGHSIGEYVAACISGVFSLEDALSLVTRRGELMQRVQPGTMLSISIPEAELQPLLSTAPDVSLAAVNSSELCVVSGVEEAIGRFRAILETQGYASTVIRTSHAFHSSMMDGILGEFEREVSRVKINKQQIPFISNLSGKPADDAEISRPQYWVRHLRETVRFSEGVETVLSNKNAVFIEVGPGNALGTFVRTNRHREKGHRVIHLVRHPKDQSDDLKCLLSGVGELWLNGVEPAWGNLYENEVRRKVSLPTYSFEKTKYPTIADATKILADLISNKSLANSNELPDWFHIPTWEVSTLIDSNNHSLAEKCNILFIDKIGIGNGLKEKLEQKGEKTICVEKAKTFSQKNEFVFEINPALEKDYIKLFEVIGNQNFYRIIFTWGISDDTSRKITISQLKESLDSCYYGLLSIVKAMGSLGNANAEIIAITNNLHAVLTADQISPEKSPLLGALKVIPKEYSNVVRCQNIDIILSEKSDELIEYLLKEITLSSQNNTVAYRNKTRFIEVVKSIKLADVGENSSSFISGGVYLITGGIGGIGLSLTKQISNSIKGINFILLGRKILPSKNEWKSWLNLQNSDNPLFNIIKDLQLIEENGGHVSYYSVDITDKEKLEKIVLEAEEEFGRIRGVIHTAGVADYGGVIYRRTKEDDEKIFAAKIYGTIILNDIFLSHKLDFFVLCSSAASFYAPFGEVGYVSANLFLDSFSKYNSIINNTNMISIGWNAWKEVGMGVKAAKNRENYKVSSDSISPEEGYQVLLRSIKSKMPKLLISKGKPSEFTNIISKDDLLDETSKLELESRDESFNSFSATSTEEKLLTLLRNFFGKPEIEIDDDFFEIGGDSLKALTLITQIHKAFNVELSIIDIFNRSSIRKLSDYIGSLKFEAKGVTRRHVSIPKAGLKEYYPLSSAQKRLFFLYEFDKTSLAYNMPQVVKLEGGIDRERLSNAFNKLIARHDSLRTSFEVINDLVVQKILDRVKFEIEYFNSDEKNVPQIIKNFIRPFDLSRAPLIRVGFIEPFPQEHILMVDTHHIITDGVSHAILIKEFMALYNNEVLPELELQYKDYAEWQQSEEQQQVISKQKAFWLNEFTDEVTTLSLPTDFKRPSIKSYEGNSISFTINKEETIRLKSIAEAEGVTLFMVLLSFYTILLSKLSNHEDVVVGTPVAGRGHTDLENMIGMFVNTLPLRNYPKGELEFRNYLSEVKFKILACFDNQSYQYEELIDELKLVRDTSRNPLFEVLFVFLNYEMEGLKIPGLTLSPYSSGNTTSKFDLSLTATESYGQIFLVFEYSTGLFRKETIERFIEYFRKIVSDISENQNKKLSDIEIISEKEKQQLLYEFNNTKTFYPNKTIHELFEEQVKRTPNSVALVFNGIEMTYKELNEKSNQFARFLLKSGVKTEDVVGVMIDRSIEMIIGIFGILKSGGACLPIDPEYPEDRINDIIELSKPEIVLSSKKQIANGIETIVIDKQIELFDSSDLELDIKSSNLIYIIYTSGSTGKPKGVMLEHKNLVNLIVWAQENTKITYDKVLQFATLSFDMSFHEIFSALLNGGSLFLIDEILRMDALRLLKYIDEKEISTLWLPTAYLKYVLNSDEFTDVLPKKVKHIITAGEQLIVRDHLRIYLRENNICLYNFYGPSETHVVTALTMNSNEYIADIPSIGMPISNTSVFIVDNNMHINPIGVGGELLVSGDQVGRGYLYREDLTQEKFIYWEPETGRVCNKETRSDTAIRVYRTGDICQWLPDGNIEFFGRIDHQVKIRGFRVELGEIETILLKYKKIKEAIVIPHGEKGDNNLCAYIVSEGEFDLAELRTFLSQRLPDYMLPSYFVRLEAMPLNQNGKVDRKSLPKPEVRTGGHYKAPLNNIEEKLVAIWSEVLKISKEQISIDKNFFELGGHSLRAMILINKIHKEFNINIALKEIFNKPTIESFADFITTLRQLDSNSNINNNEKIKEVII